LVHRRPRGGGGCGRRSKSILRICPNLILRVQLHDPIFKSILLRFCHIVLLVLVLVVEVALEEWRKGKGKEQRKELQ
jgi:hypothetical protein